MDDIIKSILYIDEYLTALETEVYWTKKYDNKFNYNCIYWKAEYLEDHCRVLRDKLNETSS